MNQCKNYLLENLNSLKKHIDFTSEAKVLIDNLITTISDKNILILDKEALQEDISISVTDTQDSYLKYTTKLAVFLDQYCHTDHKDFMTEAFLKEDFINNLKAKYAPKLD